MKRFILLSAVLACTALGAVAQEASTSRSTFKKNDLVLSAGIGLGTALDLGTTLVPPISFRGEYGLIDNLFDEHSSIGVGGYVGFAAGRKKYGEYYQQKINCLLLGVRGTFHYQFVDNLDTYIGLMLGGNIANTRNEGVWAGLGDLPTHGGFLIDVYLGARYYVIPKLAVFGEFGFGVAYFNVGVSFKI